LFFILVYGEEEEERYEKEYGELEWCKKWYIVEQAIND